MKFWNWETIKIWHNLTSACFSPNKNTPPYWPVVVLYYAALFNLVHHGRPFPGLFLTRRLGFFDRLGLAERRKKNLHIRR